ncbi:MAG TPA: glycine cleavage T C-terminal barrel domain-containing protein [Thermoleophilaceae bacterium]
MIATTEYERLRETAGLLDRSARGKFLLTGAEVGEFLQGQVTNDVEALRPGQGCYAALLDHKGKIRADMRVLRGADWFWIDCETVGHDALARTIKMYSLGRDVKSEDVTDSRAILSIIGPAAREALDTPPPDGEHAFLDGEHGIYVATDLGVDIICDAAQADTVREALGIEPVAEEAAECLRIESGRPRHGLDMGPETMPQEAGLNERAVNFEKGCYVGQETVARLHYKGKPNRSLLGLRLTAEVDSGAPIMFGDKQVGTIGSVCVSPAHGPIALALVRREAAVGDTVSVGDEAVEAEVVELPFERR